MYKICTEILTFYMSKQNERLGSRVNFKTDMKENKLMYMRNTKIYKKIPKSPKENISEEQKFHQIAKTRRKNCNS